MERKKYVYCWKDGDMWLGYLEEYPDYMTQGETLEELKENLKDIGCILIRRGGKHDGIIIQGQKYPTQYRGIGKSMSI